MSYTPKSEEELAEAGLMEKGEYDFEVIETSDRDSKSGNSMATLKLNVFDNEGNGNHIYDYMVLNNHYGERKWRHAAAACGLLDEYSSGKLVPKDFLGKTGKCKVKIAPGNDDFPNPKNVIDDYISRKVPESVATGALPPEIEGDNIPF